MTTLAVLTQDCRDLIGDTDSGSYFFTATQILEWINNAVSELSQFFPRRLTLEFETVDDVHQVPTELNDVIGVYSVEYPADEDPPVYLKPREYTHPNFWNEPGYYCFVLRHDASDIAGSYPEIWLSEKPIGGAILRVEMSCEHNPLSASNDVLTILPRHEHLIHLFVRWKAWSEIAIGEGMDPDPTKLLAATEEVNAYRAERAYRTSLKAAQQAESATGIVELRMDSHDRIY